MGFLAEKCTFSVFNQEMIDVCLPFDCGHADLNDFFANDSVNYSRELFGKSYCFRLDEDTTKVVCAFTISNDSIKANTLPNSRKKKVSKKIPWQKHFKNYPAVLIGRLGVSVDFKRLGVGTELMDFIKAWFIDLNNKTGCRFVVVDSYNEPEPLNYYRQNDFEFLFSTEEQEKAYMGLDEKDELKTRLMYFDLIVLKG